MECLFSLYSIALKCVMDVCVQKCQYYCNRRVDGVHVYILFLYYWNVECSLYIYILLKCGVECKPYFLYYWNMEWNVCTLLYTIYWYMEWNECVILLLHICILSIIIYTNETRVSRKMGVVEMLHELLWKISTVFRVEPIIYNYVNF